MEYEYKSIDRCLHSREIKHTNKWTHINMNDQDIRTTGCPTKNMYAVDTTKISSYINQLLLFFDKSTNTHTHKHIPASFMSFFSGTQRKQTSETLLWDSGWKLYAIYSFSYSIWEEAYVYNGNIFIYSYVYCTLTSVEAIFLPCEITLSHSDSYH